MEVVIAKHRNYVQNQYFDPCNKHYQDGDEVILEIGKLKDYGKILKGNQEVSDKTIKEKLPKVIRKINDFDRKKISENSVREKKAFKFCKKYINEHKLLMNLISVEYSFDRKKLKFFFSSHQKVDFRALVKELVEEFKTGVDLRQIGVRDACKMLGAIGICGRVVCCNNHLNEFKTVNLKIARSQNILSSPDKISGICGRLRCCLLYENKDCCKNKKKNEKK